MLTEYIEQISKLIEVPVSNISIKSHLDFENLSQRSKGLERTTQISFFNEKGKPSKLIAWFQLSPMPGCCGYVISHYSVVNLEYRGKGLGTLLNKFRIELCKQLGYTAILCTDLKTNEAQRKILHKNGWKDIHEILNKRTGNRVCLTVHNIT